MSLPPSSPPPDFFEGSGAEDVWEDTDEDVNVSPVSLVPLATIVFGQTLTSSPLRTRDSVFPDDIDDTIDTPLTLSSTTRHLFPILSPLLPLRTPLSLNNNRQLSSDPGVIPTSPVRGRTSTQRAKKNREKAARKKRAARSVASGRAAARKKVVQEQAIGTALRYLDERSVSFMDVLVYVFDPSKRQGDTRWSFFKKQGNASKILDFWVSSQNSDQGRTEVSQWAVSHVAKLVSTEAWKITKSGILQSMRIPITLENVLNFDMHTLFERFRSDLAKTTTHILRALTVSPRRLLVSTGKKERKQRTETVIMSSMLAGLGEYSRANNFSKRLMALYLFATGTARQVISLLSHLGMNESYSNLIAKDTRSSRQREKDEEERKAGRTPRLPKGGTLKQLSDSARGKTRSIAAVGLYGTVYDNINMRFRIAEQILGRHDTQENGTCATIWPLRHADPEAMKLAAFKLSFDEAPPLSINDILLNEEETRMFSECLIHGILRIIVAHGGDGFKNFANTLADCVPRTGHLIDLSEGATQLYPLPAFEIDESTVVGNAEVDHAIVEELQVQDQGWFWKQVRIIAGDQLLLARLRAIFNLRAGKEGGYGSFAWGVWMPGLFHSKITDMHGMFTTHWGKPNCGNRNPGSLAFHNTQLNRLPILLTSLPPFRTCRDLVFVSLYARILHCLLIVSKASTLEECAAKIEDFEQLYTYGKEIYETYTNSQTVTELRWERSMELAELSDRQRQDSSSTHMPSLTEGDMVYENALLFLRDALISREFTDAIKCGDSGRVLLVLKTWSLSFRGNGRTKYGYEMLHIIHNFTHVWPEKLRKIVLDNWLLNPSGRPNSWVEVDLVQEHMNFWIKTYYKAQGSNASWDFLKTVAPCVQALRHITGMMNGSLGLENGTKHSTPDLSNDIAKLMESLDEHKVYEVQKGRVLDNDDSPVVDVVSVGLQNLIDPSNNPLEEYNRAFVRLQARRRMIPVVDDTPSEFRAPAVVMSQHSPLRRDSPQDDGASSTVLDSRTDDTLLEDDEHDVESDGEEALAFLDDEDEPTLERLSAEDVSLDMDEDFDPNLTLNEECWGDWETYNIDLADADEY